jgi:hypothetical protein
LTYRQNRNDLPRVVEWNLLQDAAVLGLTDKQRVLMMLLDQFSILLTLRHKNLALTPSLLFTSRLPVASQNQAFEPSCSYRLNRDLDIDASEYLNACLQWKDHWWLQPRNEAYVRELPYAVV